MVNKAKYRSIFLQKRKMLSNQAYAIKNVCLLHHFLSFIKKHPLNTTHSFLPMSNNKEVNTWQLITALQNNGSEIVVSKSNLSTNTLTHYLLENDVQILENKWGIPEPTNGIQIEVESIEAVLIPLIVFDRVGHRVGYGKGYYDRFLSSCHSSCVKVGLSLSPPLDYIPCMESHDIPMDYCVTPNGIYSFENTPINNDFD